MMFWGGKYKACSSATQLTAEFGTFASNAPPMKLTLRLLLLAALAVGIGLFFYFKPAPDRSTESASTVFEAKELFMLMYDGAATEYLDQIVAVSGQVKGVDGKTLMLQPGIACRMEGEFTAPERNEWVTVKGRVLGYDGMFQEVQMDYCVIP